MPLLSRMVARLLAHPRWLALFLGALAACGFQPLAFWPATLLAMMALIELTARAARWRDAALIGWLFGLAHFTVGNNWIATAFTYQANMPTWLGGIAVVLLSLYLAVYPMLAVLGAWAIGRRADDGRRLAITLAFAGCWIVSEWLRAWVFTGFAWNPLAMVTLGGFARPGLAMLAPTLGTYALSGLVILLAGCWLMALRHPGGGWRTTALAVLPVALFLLPAFGHEARQGTLPFTLVQPDIRQDDLNEPRQWEDHFVKTARLTLPLALLCIGGTLSLAALRASSGLAIGASLLKMVWLPLLATLGACALGFRDAELAILFLYFASPTAAASFVMARAAGGNAELAAAIIVITTLAAVFTTNLGLFVLRWGGWI